MHEFTMSYTVHSFFFNEDIRFVWTCRASSHDDAVRLVLAHNRLAENIREESVAV